MTGSALWDEDRADRQDFRRTPDHLLPTTSLAHTGGTSLTARPFYEALAANYRQLVRNYEDKREYEAAEHFYVGEMEVRRKLIGAERPGRWLDWANLPQAYKLLSWYGSSVWRASWVLVVEMLIFAWILMMAGFGPTPDSTAGGSSGQPGAIGVNYDFVVPTAVPDLPSFLRWINDFAAAFRFVGSVVSFQRDRFFAPIDGWGQMWLILAVFVLTGQVALVLFSLRRRFKR